MEIYKVRRGENDLETASDCHVCGKIKPNNQIRYADKRYPAKRVCNECEVVFEKPRLTRHDLNKLNDWSL